MKIAVMAVTIEKETLGAAFLRFLEDVGPVILDRPLSKEAFMDLSNRFPELQMEREKDGKVIIMSPVKPGSGNRESIVITYLGMWWLSSRLGKTFSSSTGIELPSGATKSPDCAWISPERLEGVASEELEAAYLKVVPDFVVEILSESDRLARLKKKDERRLDKKRRPAGLADRSLSGESLHLPGKRRTGNDLGVCRQEAHRRGGHAGHGTAIG